MRPLRGMHRKPACSLVVAPIFLALLCCPALYAEQSADRAVVETDALQIMTKRIDQLEARVKELEIANKQTVGVNLTSCSESTKPQTTNAALSGSAPTPSTGEAFVTSQAPPRQSTPTPLESDQTQPENVPADRLDLSRTLLRIRGFGDVSLHGGTRKGDSTFFSLGELNLFVTSDLSERFKFLADILFEGGPDNYYSVNTGPANVINVDVERYLLQCSLNEYLKISSGRGHVAIGYYSTAYQHSTWLQTTIGRPFLYEFEDRGGILPIHTIGVTASGIIPSGALGLHYVAEAGNGRASRNPVEQEVIANPIDDENHIAFNVALFARPDAIAGFQTGFSVYHDVLSPENTHKIGENIFAAHAILIRPNYEWLNEALLDRKAVIGTSTVFNTPGFYSQVSRQYGSYRPYFRYQYLNVAKRDPVFSDAALRHGPSVGVRFDASEYVALKLQYDYTFLRSQPGFHGLTTQVGFTF